MRTVGIALVLVAAAGTAAAVSDFQWTFSNNTFLSYRLADGSAVSSTLLYDGPYPADNPTLTLVVGNRYEVTVVNSTTHPFEVLAKGANADADVVLLSQGATMGTLEADADIAWSDDLAATSGKVTFTLTPALAAAMKSGGAVPGYRCMVHTSTMRGDFDLIGIPVADPIPGGIPQGSITVELETVTDGLVSPLGAAFPDDATGRIFVWDQTGQIWIVGSDGNRLPTPLLDLSARLVPLNAGYDERGLLGVALHADFAQHPVLYTYTSEPVEGTADFTVPITGAFNHQDVLAEWTISAGNPNLVDMASRRELLRNDHPQSNHNGGALHFGPDGMLYLSIGDGGAGDDQGDGHAPEGNAQLLDRILGKILRIDVDGGGTPSANGQYGIPVDNPFLGAGMAHEIYVYGLRNPYSFHFDYVSGGLYIGDAGQNDIEEVDLVSSGDNCGWHIKEGSFFFNPNGTLDGFVTNDPVVLPVPPGLTDPIAEYDHDEGTAVIGGVVYRGTAIPPLAGRYVFADLGQSFSQPSGRLFYLDAANAIQEFQIGAPGRPLGYWPKGFAQDAAGEVYLCVTQTLGPSGTTGALLKIIPFGGNPVGPTADFTADVNLGEAPLLVQFTDTSQPGSGAIDTWQWSFGDGATSALQNPAHTYTTPGAYNVVLTVSTGVGSNTMTKTGYVTVEAPANPTAEFTADLTSGVAPLSVVFTDHSTPGSSAITGWLWEFGDSVTSTEQNPTHVYSTPGMYTVSLTVTTAAGSNTATKPAYIVVRMACGCAGGKSGPENASLGLLPNGDLLIAAGAVLILLLVRRRSYQQHGR